MSISFNVLGYLLNMKEGVVVAVGVWVRVYKTPLISLLEEEFCHFNMRSLGLLAVALHASLLALLQAQGPHKTAARDGAYMRSMQRFSLLDRSSSYHLPTYMMHLYRNFRSNFSRPLDTMERDAARQADTVKSVVAKGEIWSKRETFLFFLNDFLPRCFLCLFMNASEMLSRSVKNAAPDGPSGGFESTSPSQGGGEANNHCRDQRVKRAQVFFFFCLILKVNLLFFFSFILFLK